jgi:hypothetical protein
LYERLGQTKIKTEEAVDLTSIGQILIQNFVRLLAHRFWPIIGLEASSAQVRGRERAKDPLDLEHQVAWNMLNQKDYLKCDIQVSASFESESQTLLSVEE